MPCKEELKEEIKKVKNIIFDMDGTLANTGLATVRACHILSKRYGFELKDAEVITSLIGCASPEYCYRLYPDESHDIMNKYSDDLEKGENEIIYQLGKDYLYPGVLKLLKLLEENDYYLTVASTGSTGHVGASLDAGGIRKYFRDVQCNSPDKSKKVKKIIDNGPNGNWIIVGDKKSDSIAGKSNNIISIAAKYGFGSEEEYSQFQTCINKPLDLLTLLGVE